MTDDAALERRATFLLGLERDDEEYSKYLDSLPEGPRERVRRKVSRLTHGLHAVAPLACQGPTKCPFVDHCPIPETKSDGTLDYGPMSNYPLHRSCLLEVTYMKQKVADYMQHLEVDPQDPVEIALVNELAVIDLYKNRALMVLSTGDRDDQGRDFLRIDVTGFSDSGTPSTSTNIHPAFSVIDVLEKRRDKLLSQLMVTRKAHFEMRQKLGLIEQDRTLMDELRELRELMEKRAGEVHQLDLSKERYIPLDDD